MIEGNDVDVEIRKVDCFLFVYIQSVIVVNPVIQNNVSFLLVICV